MNFYFDDLYENVYEYVMSSEELNKQIKKHKRKKRKEECIKVLAQIFTLLTIAITVIGTIKYYFSKNDDDEKKKDLSKDFNKEKEKILKEQKEIKKEIKTVKNDKNDNDSDYYKKYKALMNKQYGIQRNVQRLVDYGRKEGVVYPPALISSLGFYGIRVY